MKTVYVLTRINCGILQPVAHLEVVGVFDKMEDAVALRESYLNSGRTSTSNFMDYAIHETPYHTLENL